MTSLAKSFSLAACAALSLACAGAASGDNRTKPAPAPNGIELPAGYKDWRLISVAHRSDKPTMRAVLGNDIAIQAARSGKTNPWPDGAIIAKLVWKNAQHPNWAAATVPGDFVHAEFMLKDSKKYATTGGWGWARWTGMEQKPYGANADFTQECVACHQPMKNNDLVFTKPVQLP